MPPQRRRWGLVAVLIAVNIGSIAAAATIAYAIGGRDSGPVKSDPPTTVAASRPEVSASNAAAAKDKVCHAVDAGQRGIAADGGVVTNGELNIPTVVRNLNTVVAVNTSLSPAVPTDVSDAAQKYVSSTIDLTTAALAHAPVDQLVQLTKTGNTAVDALLDTCGLPH